MYFKDESLSATQIEFCYDKLNVTANNLLYISAENSAINDYFIVQFSSNGIDNWTNISIFDDVLSTTFNSSNSKNEYFGNLNVSKRLSYFYRAVFSASQSNLTSGNVNASIGSSAAIISTTLKIQVNPLPVVGNITGASQVCVGLTTTLNVGTITGGSGTYSSTLWSTSVASKGTINSTGVVTGVSGGTTSITYKVTDNKGCESFSSAPFGVTVNALPVAGTITGSNEVCVGLTTTLNVGTITGGSGTYSSTLWSSSVASKGTINATGVLTGVDGGSTNISYTVTDNKGCVSTASSPFGVTVNALPTITTTGTLSGLCYSSNLQSATLSYTASTYTPTSYTVDWNAAAITAGLNNKSVTPNSFLASDGNLPIDIQGLVLTGTYYGSLKIANANGCSSTKAISILIKPLPVVRFDVDAGLDVCQNTEVTYTTQSGKTNYLWTPSGSLNTEYVITNGGLGLTNNTVSLKWLTTGPKTMQVNYTDVNSCTAAVTTNTETTVNPLPTKPTLTSQTICEGQSTNVSMSAPTGVYTYTWQVPTGVATSTTNSVNTTKAGTYSLTITNANNCTSEVGTGTVIVNTLPTKPTLTSQTICEGQSTNVSMSAPTGVYTYTWQVPTGVATSTTNSVNTTKAGTYSLTITNANNCTSEVGTGTVIVNTLPTKPTLTSQTICEGQSTNVSMSAPTGVYTYTWQVPTGVATSTTNSVNTTKAGTYSLTITDANTCTSEVGTSTVTVNQLPAKPSLTSQTICEGQSTNVEMTLPTGTYTYTWTVPTGVATSTTKTVSTNKAGTYSLTITDANTCTSEAGTATVTINQLPAKPTLTSSTICEGATATITGPTGVYTYTWQVPTGVATSTTKSVSTSKAGTYSLTITDANSCTSEVGTATVSVNALPPKPTLTSPVICEGATATVTMSTPTGTNTYTYNWRVPTGVATSTSNSVTTTKAGTYSLTITDANTCTSEVGIGTVTVNALPTVTITNPSAVCAPGTVDLTATAITAGSTSSLTYTYFTNAAATTSLVNAGTISTTGSYFIKGTTALNCSAIKPVNTTINPIPTFTISSPSVCLGNPLTIKANPSTGVSTDYNYTWQVPNGAFIPGNVSSFTTTNSGVYTATIKNKNTSCESASLNNTVSFYPIPTAAAIVAPANKVIVNKTLALSAAASGGTSPYNFTWTSNSFYTISGQDNAELKALREGKINIKYQVKDANNCEANSADFEITIESEKEILIFPNAFTPNGDGNNDIFKIASYNLLGKASFLYFEIYNRNGQLMGKRYDNINDGWDGKHKDVIQDMGIYFVKLVKMKDGKQVVENAQFYLLK